MNKKQLGNTDLFLSPVVFGGNIFGWTVDESVSTELLNEFTGAGFNMIDTADVYSRWKPGNKGGESETIIGNWLKKHGKRKDVLISTKVGQDMGRGKKDVTKNYIIAAAEASLKRLQVETIDLLSTHFDDEVTPVEETMAAYDALKKAGKVRWAGTSNMSAERIKESLAASDKNNFPRYQSLQPLYSLLERKKFETEYEQLCIENNIGVISYFSLASGFLTGKYRTKDDLGKSARGGKIDKNFNARGYAILDALDTVSANHDVTQASVALAWLIAKPAVTAPIASVTTTAQLTAMIAAAYLHLNEDEMALLDNASSE